MLSLPKKIGLLPEHLIDQIKAGEVIERPGNLIKEILENSIDAGATRVELTIQNNGLDLINLKDNGFGIISKDLPLAFSRHATSKISRFEDLYRLDSFGFRGEALASISAISKLQCVTFNDAEDQGSEVRIEGGILNYQGSVFKNSGQRGTELNIQDLFFNTPVRLKFIQSHQSEKNFIKKIIFSFILAHPKIEFLIKLDADEKEVYPARDSLNERLLDLVPRAKAQILYSVRSYEENNLEIYLIPGSFRTPTKFQYTFINHRFVTDKQLSRIVSNALQSSFGTDDFHFVLFVNLPADHIDVNVHPNKTIIKIFESSKVIGLISGSIKEIASVQKQGPQKVLPKQDSSQFAFSSLDQEISQTLVQERHQYNMDGVFSPHSHKTSNIQEYIWINQHFLIHHGESWKAISAAKLLKAYIEHQFSKPTGSTIPLIVSQPFKITTFATEQIESLSHNGLELEKLGQDTIVLRAIPEWMNGFPLKDIVNCLLNREPFDKILFDQRDWSQSTWEEMIEKIGVPEILERKIGLELGKLLQDKL